MAPAIAGAFVFVGVVVSRKAPSKIVRKMHRSFASLRMTFVIIE